MLHKTDPVFWVSYRSFLFAFVAPMNHQTLYPYRISIDPFKGTLKGTLWSSRLAGVEAELAP